MTVTVGGARVPLHIWPATAVPADPARARLERGRARRQVPHRPAGFITGIRFYKGAANTGTHVGHLWSAAGTLLRYRDLHRRDGAGWQQVAFPSPVAVAANTTYVASYCAPNGHYADDVGAFSGAGVDSPPLHALRSGVDGPNGVWAAWAPSRPTTSPTQLLGRRDLLVR